MTSPLASVHFAVSHPASSLTPALQTLGSQTWQAFQIVLIDNASQDVAVPWTHGAGPEVMLLRNFRDQGFARAHNQALTSLFARWEPTTWSERFIVIASARVMFAPDTLAHFAQAFEQNPSLMALAPKVRQAHLEMREDSDEPDLVDNGVLEQMGVQLGRGLVPVSRGRNQKDDGQYDGLPADLLGTWCVAIRASALMQAKLGDEWLDADLPEAYAIADLVWRLRTLQMPMQLAPQALVWIRRAVSRPQGIWTRLTHWYSQEALREREALSYACILRSKNAAWGSMVLALPWLFMGWIKRGIVILLDPRILPAMVRSWMILPRTLHKRRFLQLAIQSTHR